MDNELQDDDLDQPDNEEDEPELQLDEMLDTTHSDRKDQTELHCKLDNLDTGKTTQPDLKGAAST